MSVVEALRARPSDARPDLRVVDPPRRRRSRVLGALGLGVLFVVLFVTVAFHVALVQNQQRIDRLNRQATAAQARYDHLHVEVDRLQSPSRVVTEAEKLGMVSADDATWLAPDGTADSSPTSPTGPTTSDHYLTVKPYLGDTP